MYQLQMRAQAHKDLLRLRPQDQKRMEAAIDQLLINPFAGKKMKGEWQGFWSARVWPFRIIYTIDKKIITVTVVAIGGRKDVYKKA